VSHIEANVKWICCSQEIAATTEVSSILQQELKKNAEEIETKSRRNVEMAYVLSLAIPTLKELLYSVST